MKKIHFVSSACLLVMLALANVASAGERVIQATIHGMTCQFCAYGLTKKLDALPGVTKANVSLRSKQATVFYRSSLSTADMTTQFQKAVTDAGYTIKHFKIINR